MVTIYLSLLLLLLLLHYNNNNHIFFCTHIHTQHTHTGSEEDTHPSMDPWLSLPPFSLFNIRWSFLSIDLNCLLTPREHHHHHHQQQGST